MSTVDNEVVMVKMPVGFPEDVVELSEGFGPADRRTPEQLFALKERQAKIKAMYQPLYRKSVAQLRRAEADFLAANDSTIGAESEADAISNLFVAQSVAQYYKHALLDVSYSYSAYDLRIHEDDYDGE